jgi:hypothetical protein
MEFQTKLSKCVLNLLTLLYTLILFVEFGNFLSTHKRA